MTSVLVLYYSRGGSTHRLARLIARGVESVPDCEALLRTVPSLVAADDEHTGSREAFVGNDDLQRCDALALGSPTRFGNMAAPLKHFLDGTSSAWLSGALVDKPACVFTSTSTLHGGQESTLLSMMIPLLHHGMIIAGLPFTEPRLHDDHAGGGPYGVSHFDGGDHNPVSDSAKALCHAQGRRLAKLATILKTSRTMTATV